VICIPLPTLQTEQFRLIEGELGVSERIKLIEELAKAKIETILLLDPIIPKINDTTTTLGMLLQMAKDYGIRMVDHRDLKCQLQNGSREYFYKELSRRDRELAKELLSIYGEENELIPEKQKELLAYLFDSCKSNDIICDRKEILTYSRKYENRTEGTQMNLLDLL